jgi:hypothetical protein
MISTIGNVLQLVGVGMVLTFLVLAMVGLVVSIMVRILPREDGAPSVELKEIPSLASASTPVPVVSPVAPVAELTTESQPEPAAEVEEPIDIRVLAVIAATVASILGPGAHVRSIRQLGPDAGTGWARAGRRVLQESHNLGMRGRAR